MASTSNTEIAAPILQWHPELDTLVDWSWLGFAQGTVSLVIEAADLVGRQGLWSRDAYGFGGGGHASLWLDDDKLLLRLQDQSQNHIIEGGFGAIPTDEPVHIAFTFGGSEGARLFINGQVVASSTYKGGFNGNDEPLVLGALSTRSPEGTADNLAHPFRGSITCAELYDDVLSESGIAALAGAATAEPAPASPPPPPVSPPPPSSTPSVDEPIAQWNFENRPDDVLNLNGINDFFALPELSGNAFVLPEGTVSLRVMLDDLGGKQGLWSKDSSGFDGGGHASLWAEGSQIVLRLQNQSQSFTLKSAQGVIEAGTPAHIAFTFGDSGGAKLFVDGALVASNSYSGGLVGNNEPGVLGALATRSGNGTIDPLSSFAAGWIDDVKIYDIALDDDSINSLASSSTNPPPPPAPPPPSQPPVSPPPPPATGPLEPNYQWLTGNEAAVLDGVDDFLRPQGETPAIMVLGDSFTVDWRGFPSQLEAALDSKGYNVEVIAYSKGGDDAGDGLARLDSYFADTGNVVPDYALVMLGINDALRSTSYAEMESDLAAIIDLYESMGTEVLLARPDPDYPLRSGNKGWTDPDDQFQFDTVYDRLASSKTVSLEPRFTEGILSDTSLLESDTIHPNSAGVAVMVENILPETLELLGPPVDTADVPELALSQGTISMVINADAPGGPQALFSMDASGYGEGGHATLWMEDTALRLRLQDDSQSYELTSAEGMIDADQFTHVAFTFGDVDGVKLYIDGDVVAADSYAGGLEANSEPWALGASTAMSSPGALNNLRHFFDGTIGDFLVFDRPLTQDEIVSLSTDGDMV